MCQARIFRHQFICTYGTFYVNCEWGSGACMCVLTLHSESLHCSCQVESFFRVKEFPPPPVLVTSSGNDADGFRGICTLGGWTRLQHLYGPRIWGPRRVRLIADHCLAQNLLRCVVGRQAAVRKSWGFMDKR